ncbi:MAG TPA: VWA domain-containing protein [Vicinamibacterales bacterium]|nr:VWA domain-containing protein [Vicinamibacterales bacterium]
MISAVARLRRWLLPSISGLLALWSAGSLVVPLGAADPLRVVLLVDSSSTMATMLTEFRAGLLSFIDNIPDDVEVALISTGGQLRIRLAPTSDKQRMREAASRFASDGGGNSFLDTMLESDKRFLRPARDRRHLFVVLTTDQPTLGEASIYAYNDFLQSFMQRRGRAHAVIIRGSNSGLASQVLENLTKNTDGLFTIMTVPNSLAMRMREVAEQVAAQQ